MLKHVLAFRLLFLCVFVTIIFFAVFRYNIGALIEIVYEVYIL